MNASRRRYLQLAFGGSIAGLAGCNSWESGEEPNGSDDSDDSIDDPENSFSFEPEAYTIESEFVDDRLHAGESIDEFNDDADAWEEWSGSVQATDSDSLRGDRSLLIETNHGVEEGIARQEFDEPMDVTDQAFSVAVKWDSWTGISDHLPISLTLWDGDDGIRFSQIVEKRTLRGWHRYDLGLNAIIGNPDLSAIDRADVMVWTGDVEATVYVDDFRTTETASESYVLFHFDDIFEGAYKNAFPKLAEHGYEATAGVILHKIGNDEYMNQAQIDDLADSGWEVCSHPHDPETFAEMDPEDLDSTLEEYTEWISDQGYDGTEYIIYPFGEISDENMGVVSRYHDLAFKVPTAAYGANITSPLLCGRANGEDVDFVHSLIDRAETYNCVLPLMYHDVGTDEDGISVSDFDETVEHIEDAENVEVITTGEWLSGLKDGEIP